ncbi:MAG: hypothetical protein M1832_003793 [Thelocarpon impressellum]|nr:MAG: hypothetical protein M1832_003793 [Thelocarpon impressellum]
MLQGTVFRYTLGLAGALFSVSATAQYVEGQAELKGTMSVNPATPHKILATFENPGAVEVSVLALNNIFDTLHRAVTVSVGNGTDGAPIPLMASHIHYSGQLYEDLYTIPAGGNFSREFDLLEYIKRPASGSAVLDVTLPGSYRGIVGPFVAPPATASVAENDTAFHEQDFGDLPESVLVDVRVGSVPIRVSVAWPGNTGPVPIGPPTQTIDLGGAGTEGSSAPEVSIVSFKTLPNVIKLGPDGKPLAGEVATQKRQDFWDGEWEPAPVKPSVSGIRVDPSCVGNPELSARVQRLQRSITDAGLLAGAAHAAATAGGHPLSYFFNADAAKTVQNIMTNVEDAVAQKEGSGSVDVLCDDFKGWCTKRGGRIRGYADNRVVASVEEALGSVVICPSALHFSAHPTPCSREPEGILHLAHVMLHELMHIDDLNDGVHIGDFQYGVAGCHSLVGNANPGAALARQNADSFAWLGSWAWELGFGVWGGQPCPKKYPIPL